MGDPQRDIYYGQISLVEAWESIDGSITAATSISTVRAGGSIGTINGTGLITGKLR